MLPSSAASIQRPVSLKGNKDTKLAEDAELLRELASLASVAADGAVLDPVLPAKEGAAMGPDRAAKDAFSLKRKAVTVDPDLRLPRIQRKTKNSKVERNGFMSNAWICLFIFCRPPLPNFPLSCS